MNISTVGLNLIKTFEGCVLHEYKDVGGVPTIGFGHTGGVQPNQKITQAQADALLTKDVAKFVSGVSSLVKVPINQNQFDALIAFSFNLGIGCLQKSDLLALINKKNFVGASKEFARFCHVGKTVVQGLVRRREAERALFVKPIPVVAKPTILTHVVTSGETVGAIAKRFGSSIAQIKSWNGLNAQYLIRVGQKLRVK